MANLHIAALPTSGNNVLELPPPYGKVLPRENAGDFLLPVVAHTDCIGGDVTDREYRVETLIVDPDVDLDEMENDTLLVGQFRDGWPSLMVFLGWTGRNHDGRFVPSGDPSEVYVTSWGLRVARDESQSVFRIVGRLVSDAPRRCPIVG